LPPGVDLGEYLDPSPEPGDGLLVGQILVSVDTVCRRGPLHAKDLPAEMAFMVIHGFLHVLGFDHAEPEQETRMRRWEEAMMKSLGHELFSEERAD